MRVGSGIHSAINGKIGPGDVRGLRPGDERHHRRDLINTPIAAERCGGLLRYRPIARRGIQVRVDRTRLASSPSANFVPRTSRGSLWLRTSSQPRPATGAVPSLQNSIATSPRVACKSLASTCSITMLRSRAARAGSRPSTSPARRRGDPVGLDRRAERVGHLLRLGGRQDPQDDQGLHRRWHGRDGVPQVRGPVGLTSMNTGDRPERSDGGPDGDHQRTTRKRASNRLFRA